MYLLSEKASKTSHSAVCAHLVPIAFCLLALLTLRMYSGFGSIFLSEIVHPPYCSGLFPYSCSNPFKLTSSK